MRGLQVNPDPRMSSKFNGSQGCVQDLPRKSPAEVIADQINQAARDEKIDVLKRLIGMLPGQPVDSICKINRTGDMQRCLLRCGLIALEQMIQSDRNFLNGCDNEDYNSLLHTAAQLNMVEMVRYLVGRDDVCIAKNKYGLTALDIINRRSKGHDNDNDSEEIRTLLQIHKDKWEPVKENFFENKLDSIKLVASLIACVTFQGGLNPPGGVLQEDKYNPSGELLGAIGTSVMAFTDPHKYRVFWIVNTLAFVCSMSIMLLMMTGFRFERTSMRFLSVGMWSTIAMMGYTYFEGLQFITPTVAGFNKNRMGAIFMSLWLGFAGIILLMRINHYTKLLEKIKESNLFRSTPGFISGIFNHGTNQENANSVVNQNDDAHLTVRESKLSCGSVQ
ncbi:hypothetical protein LguiA_005301 [Lonicera macranthoides]